MTKKRVWRYYCEHCKRGTCSASATLRHEKGCCKNPLRICGFCQEAEFEQQPIAKLIETLIDGDVAKLREASEGCPMCMLSAIVQSKIQYPPEADDQGRWVDFDFKKERDAFWSDQNDAKSSQTHY